MAFGWGMVMGGLLSGRTVAHREGFFSFARAPFAWTWGVVASLVLGAGIPARSASGDEGEQEPSVHSFQRARLGWAEGAARSAPLRHHVEIRAGHPYVTIPSRPHAEGASAGTAIGGSYLALLSDAFGVGVALERFPYQIHELDNYTGATLYGRPSSVIAAQLIAEWAPVHFGRLGPFLEAGAGAAVASGYYGTHAVTSIGGGARLRLAPGLDAGLRASLMFLNIDGWPGQFHDRALMLGGFLGTTFGGER